MFGTMILATTVTTPMPDSARTDWMTGSVKGPCPVNVILLSCSMLASFGLSFSKANSNA